VLPFANLSNDPEQQYFADGITGSDNRSVTDRGHARNRSSFSAAIDRPLIVYSERHACRGLE
jgi:hypothetical protein